MKRTLLVLAFGACSGIATAQSSVTLTGILDVNGRYVKTDGQVRRYSEGTDGLNNNELTVRGFEDLGGGLRAGFVIRSGFLPDTGGTFGKFWNRRATVSLLSNTWGEVRLGRDFLATSANLGIYDAFGFVGIGGLADATQMFGGLRSDNAVQYYTPNTLGGFYLQLMAAPSEGGTTNTTGQSPADKPGVRYLGGRVGFAQGPGDIAFAMSSQRYATNATVLGVNNIGTSPATVLAGQSQKTWNAGGAWDFGPVKLMGFYDRNTVPLFKNNLGAVSAIVRFGTSEVHAGYSRSKFRNGVLNTSTSVDMFAATYQYNLSKRTALYGTLARVDNKDGTNYALPGSPGPSSPGGDSKGGEFGIRHIF